MRRLLLFTSALLLITSCAETLSREETDDKAQIVIEEAPESTIVEMKTVSHHSELMESSTPAESNESTTNAAVEESKNDVKIIERPRHLAPNQSEIDSIKAAKLMKKK